MIEKVNPMHPDKIADRISGAIVDLAYQMEPNPKIAVEVLIGHGVCHIIAESSVVVPFEDVQSAVRRITGIHDINVDYKCVKQDVHLSDNQNAGFRCGDNGIFKGVPLTEEQKKMSRIARDIYNKYPADGKYILNGDKLIICQSNAKTEDLLEMYPNAIVNPLGEWTGGTDVDTGATNRKLGSDMADSVTGGGLCGKDFSKADVSVNIYAFLKAQETGKIVNLCCAICDTEINGVPYGDIVDIAKNYVFSIGGFEKFAEWGLY
jgi:S-adenosylmethionine synthetase